MLDNSVTRLEVRSGARSVIPAQQYQAYDSVTVVDAAESLGDQPYVAVRQGNDLVLLYADGTEVVLQDYFLGDTLFSMDGLGGVIELPADMAPIGTVDGKALYAFGGSPDAAGSILAKSSSFSPLEPLLADETLGAALLGEGSVGLALGGLGAGGLGLAAMGGGGGAAAFFGSVSNALTVITGTFVAGPVIPGNGLVVDIYDAQGQLIQAGIPLNEDGSFSVTLQGTVPNVIAIMRDLNENPDYRDEATGADTDLDATLMGLGAGDPQPNGTTNVSLNINPVTTVAARLAGVSSDGTIPAGGVSPEKITESIQKVQDSFGLPDINGVAPKDIFDEDFNDTDGDIDDGERYGQVLAMLSGKDKLNGDQGATIEEFVSAIEGADDTAGAQSAVRSELLAGAREFEFNNESGTQTEADLLRAPSLGVERTPEVGEDGETTEPSFSALLEDSLEGTSTGTGANANAETIEGFQTLVDTADAVQALAVLDPGAEIPQEVLDQLTEENLTALGLTGLAAPSPYLEEFLEALRDAEAGGADTVAELQALLDAVIEDILTPSQDVTANDDGTLSVSGTGEPGSTVTTTFPDGSTGTALVAEDGSYGPITSEAPQTSGDVSVTATDEAGNTSDPLTEAYSDTTAPLAPSQDVTPNDDGTLSVSGTGEPGSTVTAVFPDGTTGTALVAEDGTYGPITSEAPQTTGAVSTRQSDVAGNTSPLTTEAYTDTTAPLAPSIGAVTANDDGTLSVSGTGEPGSTATVRFPDGTIGAAVVGPDGTFGPITSSSPQTTGDVTATQTDGAGNVSPAETVAYSDTAGPQAPVLGDIEQNLDGTLSVSGTGEPGAIASVTFPDGSIGTTTVRPDGSFGPVTSDAPQTDGTVSALQTDEAGNPSESDTATFDDGQAPLAPANLVAAPNEDGTINVSGTGEPGSTATVTFPDGETATVLVGDDGTFGPVTSAAPQTTGEVSVTQTDEAGNTSAPAATEAYFDETPPLPVNLIVTPNDDGTIDVSGTGEPGSTATVFFPDGTTATALIVEDGTFGPLTSEAPQTTGAVTATQTDEANNVSEPSTEDYVDTTEPLDPTVDPITPNDDGTLSVSGTGEPGATMTVFFPDGTSATATVESDGTFGPVTSEAPQTSGDVIVNQADEAGNQSEDVVSAYTDETAPLEPFIDAPTQNEDGTLSVSGTGEPGSTVEVTFPDGTVGTALVDDSGNFGPVTSAAPQTSGEVSLTQTDEAGNTSAPVTEAYSDSTAPLAPSQEVTANDDGTLSVSGTGEPGSTVTTTFPDGTTGTALVAADGSYGPITSEAPQTTGEVSSTQTDEAGNTSEPFTEAYTDTTAPLAPSQEVTANDDGTLSVSGTGEPGSTVTTTFPDGTTGTALVGEDGIYGPITSEAPQTSGDVSVTATDAAGNTSEPFTEAYTDTTAPLAPSQEVTANDDGTLSVSGTGEPGSTVTTTFPDGMTGTALVAEDGTYGPITSEAPQTTGDVTVTATDAAGNTSEPSTEAYTDITAPLAPSQDVTTNDDGTLSVSGTGEPGSTVTTTFPDGSTGTALVAEDGNYGPITSEAPQSTGAVSTRQSDEAGNTSPLTTEAYTDTTAPLAPSIDPVTANDDGTLSVSGTGEPGSTATVRFPDGTIGAAVVGPDGTFGPITSSSPQTSGDVTATQTDGAGNVSPAETVAYSDTAGPQAPVLGDIEQNLDGTLSVSGTGEPGAIASVTFPDGSIGTTTVRPDGSFGPVTSDAPQTDGTVSALQTDEAGNPSESDTATFDDGQAPLAPANLVAAPNEDGTIDVSGTGEPGSTATVTFPDGTTATVLVGDDGTFGPVTSEAPQTTGEVSVTQTDEAGNTSAPAATEAYFDETPPLPVNLIVTPNDDGTIDVSGTGEPGSTATVFFPDGTTATALIGDDGAFGPVTSAAPQTTGAVTATQTDEANNVSAPSTEDYVDTTEPLDPTVDPITPNDDGTLSVSGTGEPGATMTVFFPDGTSATATVESDGTFGPVTSEAPQTSGDVVVNQADEAGNQSEDVVSAYTDETAPLEPVLDAPTQNEDGTLSVSGTGEPGSTVEVTFPDGTVGTALVDGGGNFGPVTSAAPQTTGDVSVTQTDEAGNTSEPVTEAYADSTAPLAPSQDVTPNDDGTLSVSGTGEPGSTVTTTFPDGTTGTALVAADGSYGPITSEAPQTTGEVSSTQTDEAGNTSDPQSETVTDETAPLAPSQELTANDDGTLSVSGTGEPGSTVTAVFPDGTTGTALVGEDGIYGPITSEAPQSTGAVSTRQSDVAGNTSPLTTEAYSDTTAPLAPSQDVTTNDDGTLSVSGTGEPGSTVTAVFPDGTTGTALVAGDGSYGPITSEAPQTTGDVSVTATDEAGNTSDPLTEAYSDTTAPLAPSQDVTPNDDGTLSVSGTGEPGSTVAAVFPDGTTGTALVGEDGSYGPITSEAPQTTGAVSTRQSDVAGNTSPLTTEAYTDTTAPLAPSQDVTTNDDGTLSVSGTGEPGSTVTTTFPDGMTGTALVAEDGTYGPITSEAPQTTGDVTVTATDAAGNTSEPSTEAYTDITAPLAPSQDVTTNDDGTLSVSGTGEPGSTVTTTFPDGSTGTALVAEDGNYGPITSEGPQLSTDVETTQTDEANNTSQPAVDETAPLAPLVDSANADGLSGTAEPGSTVTLFDDNEPPVAIATATVGEDGTWSIPAEDFPEGTTEGFAGSVTATDEAGNESAPAPITAIDGTAPDAPLVDTANADGLSGTGTAGDTITLFDDSEPPVAIATATVGEDGTWSIPAEDFPEGTTEGFAGSVTATDEAGNESAPAPITAIDGTAPDAPLVDTANADGLSGTGTAGDTITLFDDSEPPVAIATATVGEDGTWSIPAEDFPEGTTEGFAGSVTATDEAGNESAPAPITAIDGTAPDAPLVDTANADGLSGTGTAGDTITLFDDSEPPVAIATATVGEDGTWSIPAEDFPEGTTEGFAGSVTATDEAGNESAPAPITAIDGTAPTIEITTPIEGDDVVNALEDVDVLVAGTTDAETGQTVTVTFTDSASATVTAEATVSEGGWSLSGSEADISGLEEGEITVTANVSDAAGNAATEASATVTLDNSAPTIAITTPIEGDDLVNAVEDVDVLVAGTTDAETGQTVTVTFTDSASATVTAEATVTEGGWSLTGSEADISGLEEGEITVTANVSDAAGNAATEASATVTLDNSAPTIAITPGIAGDDVVNASEDQDVLVEGTTDAETGQTVTVTFTDSADATVTATATVIEGGWSLNGSGTDISALANGEITVTANVSDAAGNPAPEASATATLDNTVDIPTINPGITDQGNTVSGTGEPGATVSVSIMSDGVSEPVGSAVVWTDGTWSFVADTPIADGATLHAVQQDAAGNFSLEASQATFTDTDGDGTSNADSADDDGDGISDTDEAATESESFITYPAQTVASNMSIVSPTPGYSSGTTTDASSGSLIDITAVAPGESGNGTTITELGTGTISRFNYKANVVGGETVEDLTIGIAIGSFDDGLYVEIDGTVIVNFSGRDYQNLDLSFYDTFDYDADNNPDTGNFGFAWAPFNGEGNPELVIDLAAGTVQLLVDNTDGARSDIFGVSGFNALPNPVPTVDATSANGVTIGTGFRNANINNGDFGSISEQTITVTGRFAGADDVDGDVVAGTSVLIENWVDIDSDNDRVWDKYDGIADSDGDGVSDYRDPDSDDDGTLDGVQASLNQAQINALIAGGTHADQFIVLSDAVTMDFTAISATAFSNVEYLDMNDGANAQTVTIDAAALTAMTDADNELIIVGGSNDTVNAIGFVDTGKDQSIQGQRFNIYESNDATLIIRDGVNVSLTEEGSVPELTTPTLDASITDQANTVSGTGDAGATVTVSDGDIVIGTAVVWTDGLWSFVADSPIADGAELTVTQSLDGFTSAASTVPTFTDTDGDGTANSVATDADGDAIADTAEDEGFRNTTGTGTNDLRFVQWGTDFDDGVQVGDSQTLVLPDGSVVTFTVTGVTSSLTNGTDDNIAGAPSTFGGAFLNTRYTLPDGSINGPVDGTDTFTFAISAVDVLGNSINPTVFWADSEATADGTETNGATTNGGNWTVVEQDGAPGVNGVGTQTVTVTNSNGTGGAIYSSTNATEVTVTIQGNGGVQGFSLGVVADPNFDYQDLDQDGIDNSLDIDTDGDRLWDKYETGSDANGVPNYRDTDSDNNGTEDGVEESVTAGEIEALTTGTDTYGEGYILLSEAVTLDFTQIDDARFTADFEYIDMNDGSRQVVTLNESEVIALTDADNELIIVGDASDVVNATGFVDTGQDQSIQGQTFSIYEANGAALFIDDEITNIVTT